MAIDVVMAGVSGRTGRVVTSALLASPEFRLVGAVGAQSAGHDVGELVGRSPLHLRIAADVSEIDAPPGTVYVDFTRAAAARSHVPAALRRGWPAVVGTTGLAQDDLRAWEEIASDVGVGVCVVANFSLGAALAARLAALAIEVIPDAEIVELHGSHKLDRPSGTAAALAEDLRAHREDARAVEIHSVRLPGLVAHQEVLFGRAGELLTIRHDVFQREAYVEGVLIAIRKVGAVRGLVTRLDEIWELGS